MTNVLNDNHWLNRRYRQRITKKQLDELLLNKQDEQIINGRLLNLTWKKLTNTVYEVWFEEAQDAE